MINNEPLVSIITPCYNSSEFIARMLDSILCQTYGNIELICVDDGSVDNTEGIIKSYIEKFEINCKKLIYIHKEHNGQAAAVNVGLKIILGKYFGLLDSDDFLTSDSIEKKVRALEENMNYSIVASDYYVVQESNLKNIIRLGNDYIGNLRFQPYQFYLAIAGYSSVTPLGYLIRTEDFKKINPQMHINECKEGQNYQLLLPLYYHYKRLFINDPLGYYVIRMDSHGHKERSIQDKRERNQNLIKMLEEVLLNLGVSNFEIERCVRFSLFKKVIGGNINGKNT